MGTLGGFLAERGERNKVPALLEEKSTRAAEGSAVHFAKNKVEQYLQIYPQLIQGTPSTIQGTEEEAQLKSSSYTWRH